MKKILLLLIFTVFAILPTNAIKKIEANPINVAAILVEKTDSADMASTCEYYGYIRQLSENNYTVYKHPANGSIIRYAFNAEDPNQRLATVEVKSKASNKEIDYILKDLNFKPFSNGYERKSFGFVSRCTSGNHGYLIFSQHKKQKK